MITQTSINSTIPAQRAAAGMYVVDHPAWCAAEPTEAPGDHCSAIVYVDVTTAAVLGGNHPVSELVSVGFGIAQDLLTPGQNRDPRITMHVSGHRIDLGLTLSPREAREAAAQLIEAANLAEPPSKRVRGPQPEPPAGESPEFFRGYSEAFRDFLRGVRILPAALIPASIG